MDILMIELSALYTLMQKPSTFKERMDIADIFTAEFLKFQHILPVPSQEEMKNIIEVVYWSLLAMECYQISFSVAIMHLKLYTAHN